MLWFWIFGWCVCLMLPLIMIVMGRWFKNHAPGKINRVYGYRTTMSMKNQDTWEFAHHDFGIRFFRCGLILTLSVAIGMISLYGKSDDVIGMGILILECIQIVALFVVIAQTERALKKHFDKDGRRRE